MKSALLTLAALAGLTVATTPAMAGGPTRGHGHAHNAARHHYVHRTYAAHGRARTWRYHGHYRGYSRGYYRGYHWHRW
jgi:hypothetical protein